MQQDKYENRNYEMRSNCRANQMVKILIQNTIYTD